jgi:hypothetical protein
VSHSEHTSTKSTPDSHRHRRSTRPITVCALAAGLAVASLTGMPTASASWDLNFSAPGDGILKISGNNSDGADARCQLAFEPLTGTKWTHLFNPGPFSESLHIRTDLSMQVPNTVNIQYQCQGDKTYFKGAGQQYVN